MRRRNATRRTGAALVALAMVIAACGGDDDGVAPTTAATEEAAPPTTDDGGGNDDGATTTAASEETAPPTTDEAEDPAPTTDAAPVADGEPIHVMVTGTHESQLVSFGQAVDGVQAAADAINESGGIDGRPIEVHSCNDNLDPNQAVACIEEGIDAGVVAFVGGLELFNAQVLPRLEQEGIPWVGAEVIAPEQMTSPISFPVDAGAPMTFIELGRQLVEYGGPRVTLALSENPNAQFNAPYVERGVELAGGEVIGVVQYPLAQADFSVTGTLIADTGADAYGCICAASDFAQVLPAARQAGFTGSVGATLSAARNEDMISMGPDVVGDVVLISAVRILDDESAEIDQFRDETSGLPESVIRDGIFTKAWLGMHVVADALAGAGTYDAATLIDRLSGFTATETYGLVPSIDFAAEPPLPDEAPRLPSVDVFVYTWDGSAKVPLLDEFLNPFRS